MWMGGVPPYGYRVENRKLLVDDEHAAHVRWIFARFLEIGSCTEPAEQLETLLHAATTVPDHGGLRPWRFAVVRGAGRARFGDALAAAANDPAVRDKALAAPALIAVIAAPKLDSKIPEWEQTTSASSSGYAITLAAHGLGLGASWRSTEHMDGPALRELFGMAPTDRLLGWVNVGTPVEDAPPERREAPDLASLVTRVE
jgi:nitroreductase